MKIASNIIQDIIIQIVTTHKKEMNAEIQNMAGARETVNTTINEKMSLDHRMLPKMGKSDIKTGTAIDLERRRTKAALNNDEQTNITKLPLTSDHVVADAAITCHLLDIPSVDEYSQTDQVITTSSNTDTYDFSNHLSSVSTQTEQLVYSTTGQKFIIYQHDSTQTENIKPSNT